MVSTTAKLSQNAPGTGRIVLTLALMSLLPMISAQFGHGNQVEQFPIVARLLDPAAMAGDFYTDHAAGFGPRIYYARVLAWLHMVLPMPVIIHSMMCLFTFLLAGVTYLGARHIAGASALGGLLAAGLAVANGSFSLGLAGFLRFDSFQPANIAIALALAGLVLLAVGRPWLSVPAFAIAALMHPLIGTEIAAISFAAVGLTRLICPGEQARLRVLTPIIGAGLAFGILMYLFWAAPNAGHSGTRLTDAEFFDILIRFRAPHHYLGLEFYHRSWIEAGLFFVTVALIFVWLTGRRALPHSAALTLGLICVIVLTACVASLWFTDMQHSRLWATAQVFRMMMVVKWVGFLLLGRLIGDLYNSDRLLALACALIVLVASADAQPYAIVVVLLTIGATQIVRHLLADRLADAIVWLGLGLSVLLSLALAWRYGIPVQSLRGGLAFVLIALMLLPAARAGMVLALGVGIGAPMLAYLGRDHSMVRASYSWADHTDAEADIARQAGIVSDTGAIWAIPPDHERFVLLSDRGVVVSFTSIPFSDDGLVDWRHRIEQLYGPFDKGGFAALRQMLAAHRDGADWTSAAQSFGATHAVLYKDTPWDGQVLYENQSFKAVPLGTP